MSYISCRTVLRAAVIAVCLAACSTRLGRYPTLENEGILALSRDNPYLGANLLIGGEAERSRIFFEFLEHRGAPSAVRISGSAVRPTEMVLYYSDLQQSYAARQEHMGERLEWIVRGPYPIHRRDYKTLRSIARAGGGEPVFMIRGQQYRFRAPASREAPIIVRPVIQPPPPRRPRPSEKKPAESAVPSKVPAEVELGFDPRGPLNSDQKAVLQAKGYAPRAAGGEVLHTVSSSGGNLEAIVKWYTGSSNLVGEVAKVNSLDPKAPVPAGTNVKIPLYMVQEFKKMPAQ